MIISHTLYVSLSLPCFFMSLSLSLSLFVTIGRASLEIRSTKLEQKVASAAGGVRPTSASVGRRLLMLLVTSSAASADDEVVFDAST